MFHFSAAFGSINDNAPQRKFTVNLPVPPGLLSGTYGVSSFLTVSIEPDWTDPQENVLLLNPATLTLGEAALYLNTTTRNPYLIEYRQVERCFGGW